MAKRNVLERLWRLRELEEEQSRLELEALVGERNRIAQNLAEVSSGTVRSRGEFVARLGDIDTVARTGALIELEQGRRRETAIRPRLVHAEAEVELRRNEFLVRRTGRRQVGDTARPGAGGSADRDGAPRPADAGRLVRPARAGAESIRARR